MEHINPQVMDQNAAAYHSALISGNSSLQLKKQNALAVWK